MTTFVIVAKPSKKCKGLLMLDAEIIMNLCILGLNNATYVLHLFGGITKYNLNLNIGYVIVQKTKKKFGYIFLGKHGVVFAPGLDPYDVRTRTIVVDLD